MSFLLKLLLTTLSKEPLLPSWDFGLIVTHFMAGNLDHLITVAMAVAKFDSFLATLVS